MPNENNFKELSVYDVFANQYCSDCADIDCLTYLATQGNDYTIGRQEVLRSCAEMRLYLKQLKQ